MRNGINKIFLTSLFVIFGLCFNSNYTYGVTARLDCARDPGNASRIVDCYDIEIWETIEFTDVDSTIWNWFKFTNTIINDMPIFVSTMAWTDYIAYTTTFFIGTWYWTVDFQDRWENFDHHAQYNYIRTWNFAYCTWTTDEWNTCYQRNFTKTFEEAKERIEWLTLSWYTFIIQNRLNEWFYTNKYTYQICATYIDSDRYLCINVPHANWNASAQCTANQQCNYYITNWKTTPWIDTSFIANLWATVSPFYVEEWWTERYIKLPMCYTIQQKIDTFPSNYNTGMCYSTNKIWSGNQFVTVTPKSMLELRPTYQEYEDDVNLYQNYCWNNVANNTACWEAFSWNEDKRSIINKLYNQGTQTILRSYDYCYLQLSFTEEQKNTRTNCTMWTWLQHGSGITTNDIIEDMENHRITIITPDWTTVYSWFRNNDDIEEEANLSYDGIIKTMQSVRWKLTNIFYYRSWVTGIIPDYITRILLLIVLFAIFKK